MFSKYNWLIVLLLSFILVVIQIVSSVGHLLPCSSARHGLAPQLNTKTNKTFYTLGQNPGAINSYFKNLTFLLSFFVKIIYYYFKGTPKIKNTK